LQAQQVHQHYLNMQAQLMVMQQTLDQQEQGLVQQLPVQQQQQEPPRRGSSRDLDETNVYVAHLPITMTHEEFFDLMSQYGTVVSSRLLIGDHWRKKSVKGVGFARYLIPLTIDSKMSGISLCAHSGASLSPTQLCRSFFGWSLQMHIWRSMQMVML
jgi:hypothetical protein